MTKKDLLICNRVKYSELMDILKEKECCTSDLRILNDFINNRDVIDISGLSGNTTFIVPNDENNKESYVIKISPNDGELYDEYIVNNLFFKYGLAPEVIEYFSSNKDYLVNRFIEDECMIDTYFSLDDLARKLGSALRSFHDLKWDKEKFDFMEAEVLIDNPDKFLNISLEHSEGFSYLRDYLKESHYKRIKEHIEEYGYLFKNDDVLVHGEFNPRNIFIKDGKLDKIMGFTDTHYGDRHFDIFYTMWSLAYYSKILDNQKLIDKVNQIFLDSYGRDVIDYERLRLCGNIVCMYKQNPHEVNGLTRKLKL